MNAAQNDQSTAFLPTAPGSVSVFLHHAQAVSRCEACLTVDLWIRSFLLLSIYVDTLFELVNVALQKVEKVQRKENMARKN